MRDFPIPEHLVQLITNRRVIPFIGAGVSAAHGLPGWTEMLERLVGEIGSPVGPDEIAEACNHDPLQIAEYLFLVAGKQIGPLRHSLSGMLRSDESPLRSSAHVELVNLGSPQVYTTNFDELIEQTFRVLGRPVDVVALPRDVARTHGDATEVVKYHGDLRHEHTLVLTESQYYTRLEFESPMDLKFRSDLLGRSVLFMGYSFRDINIRVIWFKLMQMMKDVPAEDRMTSYIVRFNPNPVLDKLYDDVGLKTIVLDGEGTAVTPEEQNRLFADFMLALSMKTGSGATIPGTNDRMFVTRALLRNVRPPDHEQQPRLPSFAPVRTTSLLGHLLSRQVPFGLRDETEETYRRQANLIANLLPNFTAKYAAAYLDNFGSAAAATWTVARGLISDPPRSAILESPDIDWEMIWVPVLSEEQALNLVQRCAREIQGHEDDGYVDEDIAYAVDVLKRLHSGSILKEPSDAVSNRAEQLLERAAARYDSVEEYAPRPDGPPDVSAIEAQLEEIHGETATADDDIPF
jgi:hypothetical protein